MTSDPGSVPVPRRAPRAAVIHPVEASMQRPLDPRRHHQPRPAARRPSPRLGLEPLEDRSVPAANAIVTENQLPGTPQSTWGVSGTGDSTIQGFTTDISVNHGQTVSFKINDAANKPYH